MGVLVVKGREGATEPPIMEAGLDRQTLRPVLSPSESKCGTTTGYAQGCRCESCRDATRTYNRAYKNGMRVGRGRPKKAVAHGTITMYTKRGCRCDECRENWRRYSKQAARRYRAAKYANREQPKEKVLIHGRITTRRRHGCQCVPCRAAYAEYVRFRNRWRATHPGEPCPSPSICEVCDRNYMGKGIKGACSNACYSKRWRAQRRKAVPASETPSAVRARVEARARELSAVAAAARDNPELAELIASQERDQRVGDRVSHRWMRSLDARLGDGDGAEFGEIIGSEALDPAVILITAETTAVIESVTGNRTEEDVRKLDYRTLEHIAARLVEEDVVSISVQHSERQRLREPMRHAGIRALRQPSYGGHKTRREKLADNYHGRPSQKPRKRWERAA